MWSRRRFTALQSIRELGALLRIRQLTCQELVRDTYSAIEQRDRFNCFITLSRDAALAEAAVLDRELGSGVDRGPLHGIPIAHKDIIYTAGIRTTGASRLFADFVPTEDAEVVTRLKAAGAISIGKTNLHELAYGATSQASYFGPVLNPLDSTRMPGGSSGGSAAAVAAGFVPMALGTDTGGSIRIPASYCGVVGFKPTYERVSRRGVMPLAFGLDHVGPIGSSVEDCALTMQVLCGLSPVEATLAGLRVCVPRNFFFDRVDPEVEAAVRRAVTHMERKGAIVREAEIPDLAEANLAARVIQSSEATALYAHYTDESFFNPGFWNLIQQGKRIAGYEYVNAQRLRTLFRKQFDALWQNYDVLAAPATPIVAPRVDAATVQLGGVEEDTRMASTRLTRALNFLGEPGLSLLCGLNADGLPIGLQLIAAPHADARLLAIAGLLEPLLRQSG